LLSLKKFLRKIKHNSTFSSYVFPPSELHKAVGDFGDDFIDLLNRDSTPPFFTPGASPSQGRQ
jgi:hypothetical protein